MVLKSNTEFFFSKCVNEYSVRRCDLHFFDFEGEIEQEVEDRSCNMSPLSLYVTIRAASLLFILAIVQLLKK